MKYVMIIQMLTDLMAIIGQTIIEVKRYEGMSDEELDAKMAELVADRKAAIRKILGEP